MQLLQKQKTFNDMLDNVGFMSSEEKQRQKDALPPQKR